MEIPSITNVKISKPQKLESVQSKTPLVTTDAIIGTLCENICEELVLESLKSSRWYKHLSCMFKIMKEKVPNYLIILILKCKQKIRIKRITICEATTTENIF